MSETRFYKDLNFKVACRNEGNVIRFRVEKIEPQDEPFLCGTIKWSGCSDWKFDGYGHFCGPKETDTLSVLYKRLYAWAAELMPNADWLSERLDVESMQSSSYREKQ